MAIFPSTSGRTGRMLLLLNGIGHLPQSCEPSSGLRIVKFSPARRPYIGSNCDLPAQMGHVRSDPETGSDLAASPRPRDCYRCAADRDRGAEMGGRPEGRSHAAPTLRSEMTAVGAHDTNRPPHAGPTEPAASPSGISAILRRRTAEAGWSRKAAAWPRQKLRRICARAQPLRRARRMSCGLH
jgi:hypothetical protein